MASLKLARNVIAEGYQDAQATLAATLPLASSLLNLFVIPVTRIAVLPHANLPRAARYVVPAPEFAILKKSAVALQHRALPIVQLQMVRHPFTLFLLY
jgi:hypothetical protein